ncbi:MAG TPA: hypothetical protein IGS53_11875 [Leptolyngbyaceae cyanobacterium M33_DOE_097]|uniref:Winged helix domain-containing protein n=1 Tax=Oscillatoriales cyanobacterium SpSt-418 TaxID=2282169 RepID=A0A7C3KGQ9_9CYAN|nr:hypothetical protein [Leptolyngbyaceae cyanobacterium M33_DOE_097]
MTTPTPFPDNWSYLKTELNWLDRLLSLAIARYRKERKELEPLMKSRADRATSHWWKGLIVVDGTIAQDAPATVAKPQPAKNSYQQQLEAKIQVSRQQGIHLGLPDLRDRLRLSLFEKNLVLVALAPEISRRYTHIYNYLQEADPNASGLPTVDLLLRLLCRSDPEWRTARGCLTANSPLMQQGLLKLSDLQPEPLLGRTVQLSGSLVDYLLADQPVDRALEHLLQPVESAIALPRNVTTISPRQDASLWEQLVLPPVLLNQLQHLSHRVQRVQQMQSETPLAEPGFVLIVAGAAGTGKTMAVQAISQTLEQSVVIVDLAVVPTTQYLSLLHSLVTEAPALLLLKSAYCWFGKHSLLPPSEQAWFIEQRRATNALTFLSVQQPQEIAINWRGQLPLLKFLMPDAKARLQLWRQAFASQAPLAEAIDWQRLSRLPLTGGAIREIAQEAQLMATEQIEVEHIWQACKLLYPDALRSRSR